MNSGDVDIGDSPLAQFYETMTLSELNLGEAEAKESGPEQRALESEPGADQLAGEALLAASRALLEDPEPDTEASSGVTEAVYLRLAGEVQSLRARFVASESESARAMRMAREEADRLRAELSRVRTLLVLSSSERTASQERFERAARRADAAETELEATRGRLSSRDQQVKSLRKDMTELREAAEAESRQAALLKSDIASLSHRIRAQERARAALGQNVIKVQWVARTLRAAGARAQRRCAARALAAWKQWTRRARTAQLVAETRRAGVIRYESRRLLLMSWTRWRAATSARALSAIKTRSVQLLLQSARRERKTAAALAAERTAARRAQEALQRSGAEGRAHCIVRAAVARRRRLILSGVLAKLRARVAAAGRATLSAQKARLEQDLKSLSSALDAARQTARSDASQHASRVRNFETEVEKLRNAALSEQTSARLAAARRLARVLVLRRMRAAMSKLRRFVQERRAAAAAGTVRRVRAELAASEGRVRAAKRSFRRASVQFQADKAVLVGMQKRARSAVSRTLVRTVFAHWRARTSARIMRRRRALSAILARKRQRILLAAASRWAQFTLRAHAAADRSRARDQIRRARRRSMVHAELLITAEKKKNMARLADAKQRHDIAAQASRRRSVARLAAERARGIEGIRAAARAAAAATRASRERAGDVLSRATRRRALRASWSAWKQLTTKVTGAQVRLKLRCRLSSRVSCLRVLMAWKAAAVQRQQRRAALGLATRLIESRLLMHERRVAKIILGRWCALAHRAGSERARAIATIAEAAQRRKKCMALRAWRRNALAAAKAASTAEIATLKDNMASLRNNNSALKKRNAKLGARITTLEEEKTVLENRKKMVEKGMADVEKEMARVVKEKARVEKEKAGVEKEMKELEAQARDSAAAGRALAAEQARRMGQNDAEREAMLARLAGLAEAARAARGEADRRGKGLIALQAKMDRERARATRAAAERDALHAAELAAASDRATQAKRERRSAERAAATAMVVRVARSAQYRVLSRALWRWSARSEALQAAERALATSRGALAVARVTGAEASARARRTGEVLQNLRNECAALEAKNARLTFELSALTPRRDSSPVSGPSGVKASPASRRSPGWAFGGVSKLTMSDLASPQPAPVSARAAGRTSRPKLVRSPANAGGRARGNDTKRGLFSSSKRG